MPIDVEAEIGTFIRHCTARRPEALRDGYGVKMLRTWVESYNNSERSSRGPRSYQGNFYSMTDYAAAAAECEYALGYPLDRVRFFLRLSAEATLRCVELRGTIERPEITTSLHTCPDGTVAEEIESAAVSVDVSMGTPWSGIQGVYCAWLAQNSALGAEIARAIHFHDEDTEAYGKKGIARQMAHVAWLRGDEEGAQRYIRGADPDDPRSKLLAGVFGGDQDIFDDGLSGVLKWWERYERKERRGLVPMFAEKGLKPPPYFYWSIECMGGALLGLKRGLELRIDHPFIPREMLEGCY
jgi:hypothetical protein